MKILYLIIFVYVLNINYALSQNWGGKLTAVPTAEISNLDPYMSGGWANRQAKENLYEPLVALDSNGNLDGRVASSWEITNNGKEYIFNIRKNIYFHNGKKLTAKDVKYSLDRARDPKTGARSWKILEKISNVEIINDYKIKLTFTQPDNLFLKQIYNYTMIIPADDSINHKRNPVGSGPFKLVEFNSEHLLLERFNNYYTEGLPYLDNLEFKFVAEASTKSYLLETNAVDFVKSLPYIQTKDLENNDKIVIDFGKNIEGPVLFFLPVLTLKDSPMNNTKVRQALSYSLDREQIMKVAYGGMTTGAVARSTLVPIKDPLYNKGQTTYERDISKAKTLMKEAGYANGVNIDFYPLLRSSEDETVATIIQQNAKEAGINLKINRMDVPTWVSGLKNKKLELPFGSTYSMPGAYEQIWMIQGRMHSGYIDLKKYDKEFYNKQLNASSLSNINDFKKEIMDIQKISSEQQYVIVVGDIPTIFAFRNNVKGFESNPVGSMYYRKMWKN